MKWYVVRNGEIFEECDTEEEAVRICNYFDGKDNGAEWEVYPGSAKC